MLKILAADDQPLILTSIKHKLKDAGYELYFAKDGNEAIDMYNQINPDLLIVDLNMPEKDGFAVLNYVRKELKSQTPIIVMSGQEDEGSLIKAYNQGADEYIQKPVGLNELVIRIQKLLNQPLAPFKNIDAKGVQKLQKDIIGIVIPCYNEEARLKTTFFTNFVKHNLGYKLCFVNDGSKDNTLQVLQELSKGREDYITVLNCKENGGKAEAVRQGILHLLKDKQLDYLGYLDADLSTNFKDFTDLVSTISNSNFQIVGGSRIARMGADITKAGSRAIISKTINLIIRKILGMSFQDTQCGAKIMTREVAAKMFDKKFLTSWLFDVEIFMRMRKHYGLEKAKSMICEQPLKRWIHEDGSKLSMKDSFKILGQLFQISYAYNKI